MESGQLSFKEGKRTPRKSPGLGCLNAVASGYMGLFKFKFIPVK